MNRKRRILLACSLLILVMSGIVFLIFQPSLIPRYSYSIPTAAYNGWDEILSNPKRIAIQTYSTGMMQTDLSAIMNLEHAQATDIDDVMMDLPVNVSIIHHPKFGTYLIDAGLDSSYVYDPYGMSRGILVKKFMGKGSQDPNTHIAAILHKEHIQVQGVWLTHLHPDHIAGIANLPKDIPYVIGKGEPYLNFRFLIRSDHLSGIKALYEIDFSKGIELQPLGKGVDLFGDGSFWAIESSGHTKGHVMYFVNGVNEQVIVTGDACNNQMQFDKGIGPGYLSSDMEKAQNVLESIKEFKEHYPEVNLVFGHETVQNTAL